MKYSYAILQLVQTVSDLWNRYLYHSHSPDFIITVISKSWSYSHVAVIFYPTKKF